MHMYAEFDQNIPCGSRVMNSHKLLADGRTHPVILVQTQGSCNSIFKGNKRFQMSQLADSEPSYAETICHETICHILHFQVMALFFIATAQH